MASMVANCLSALVVVFSCETGRSFLQTEDLSARHVAREKKKREWKGGMAAAGGGAAGGAAGCGDDNAILINGT